MPKSPRPFRVADRIQAELSDILLRKVNDPRARFLTVTGVEMSPDLRLAKIYVSTLESGQLEEALAMLNHAKGFLRTELSRRLTLRVAPELAFRVDKSVEGAHRLEDLLNRLREQGELGDEEGSSSEPGETDS